MTSIRIAGCQGQDLNLGPPEYEAGVLTTQPRCSIIGCEDKDWIYLAQDNAVTEGIF
jgi:hypothetical protein